MIKNSIIIIILLLSTYSLLYSFNEWEDPVVITKKSVHQLDMAFNKRNIFLAGTKKHMDNTEIYLYCSTNEAQSWMNEKRITTSSGSSENPKIIFANNKLYLFWVDYRNGQNDIYFINSTDSLFKFKKEKAVVANASDSINPVVSTTGDEIFLVWSDDKTGTYELYIKIYNIEDEEWSDEIAVTKYSGGSFNASLLTLMDETYLCWQQREGDKWKVMCAKSDDGMTWSKPENISMGLNNAFSPFISLSAEGVTAVFQGYKDLEADIYMNILNPMEEKWGVPTPVTTDLAIEHHPVFFNTGKELNFFWSGLSSQDNDIYYAKSLDNGLTIQEKINVSQSRNDVTDFDVVYNTFNDNVYITWLEGDKGPVMMCKKDRYCPAPLIVQSSHKQDQWSMKKDVSFKLDVKKDTSGMKDFAYVLDNSADSIPELFTLDYPADTVNFYNIKDGIWYFHIRVRDNALNKSETVHHKVMINSELYALKEKYHVIKYKDTLWDVAKKYFKDPELFKKIAKYNNLDDPDLIYPHQIIKIPPKEYLKLKQ